MVDNLSQLDKSGTNCQFTGVISGPSVGVLPLPVAPTVIVTASAPIVLGPFVSQVLLKGAVPTVTLPNVKTWLLVQQPVNISPFDRSITIKDLGLHATNSTPIIINPLGADKIDGLASANISTPGGVARFYPLTDLTGWYADGAIMPVNVTPIFLVTENGLVNYVAEDAVTNYAVDGGTSSVTLFVVTGDGATLYVTGDGITNYGAF